MASIGPQLIDWLERWHDNDKHYDLDEFEYFECSFCGAVCRMPLEEYRLLDESFVLAAQFRCNLCRTKEATTVYIPKYNHYIKHTKEDYLALKQSGYSDGEIASQFNIGLKYLKNKILKWGLRVGRTIKNFDLLTPENVSKWHEQGMSREEMATRIGCSPVTLRQRLRRWGMTEAFERQEPMSAPTPTSAPEQYTEDNLPFNRDEPSNVIEMHEWMTDAEKGVYDDEPTPSVDSAYSQLTHSVVTAVDTDHIADVRNMVDHPPHYTQGKVECIDAIEAAVTGLVGMEAVYTANVIKYNWRWKQKGGVEDLLKAQWYQARLIELVSKS